MLDQNEVPFDAADALPYTGNPNVSQLKRFYPTVDISTETPEFCGKILDRTMQYMMHLDQVFSLDKTFDAEHYEKMKAEALAFAEWLESPDGTPLPEILKYTPAVVESYDEDGNENPVDVAIEVKPKAVRTPREKGTQSKYQRALALHAEDVAAGKLRSHTIDRFVNELGIVKATANVYYSIFKNAKG